MKRPGEVTDWSKISLESAAAKEKSAEKVGVDMGKDDETTLHKIGLTYFFLTSCLEIKLCF